MTKRKLSAGMMQALEETKSVAQKIEDTQGKRFPLEYLPVGDIRPSPFQARLDFTGLESLAEDIQANGVLQPILVRTLPGGGYELVAGERRLRASKLAGQPRIPAIVRPLEDRQARLYSLKENLERENLNAYEMAHAVIDLVSLSLGKETQEVIQLLSQRRNTVEEVVTSAEEALGILGKDISLPGFQRHYLPLLHLPAGLLKALRSGAPYSAVMELSRASEEQQATWLPKVLAGEWGVRDIRQALKQEKPARATAGTEKDIDLNEEFRTLRSHFSAKQLASLDTRKRKKAQKLLQELRALFETEQSAK
ncbi:ParB/RepB/Spo0J family partition protein [Deinococcus sp. Marseille-Q6407]|uniref:ParB/RepB/Spo0J family partition protein n=1 Tax=Deinococcus sp. Marseille-Q6407 TaxID=2969223 RepID=UPI0021C15433|nr:ParB/RepB/Spo0J family partition protein [Deinococcus sp. Marseille-Q6407]